MSTFDLRNKEGLPSHLESDLRGIRENTLAAVKQYVEYNDIDTREIGEAYFDEGFGDIGMKCKVAAQVAEHLQCTVHFSHNGTPATAFQSAADAACMDWDRRREAGEKA